MNWIFIKFLYVSGYIKFDLKYVNEIDVIIIILYKYFNFGLDFLGFLLNFFSSKWYIKKGDIKFLIIKKLILDYKF